MPEDKRAARRSDSTTYTCERAFESFRRRWTRLSRFFLRRRTQGPSWKFQAPFAASAHSLNTPFATSLGSCHANKRATMNNWASGRDRLRLTSWWWWWSLVLDLGAILLTKSGRLDIQLLGEPMAGPCQQRAVRLFVPAERGRGVDKGVSCLMQPARTGGGSRRGPANQHTHKNTCSGRRAINLRTSLCRVRDHQDFMACWSRIASGVGSEFHFWPPKEDTLTGGLSPGP